MNQLNTVIIPIIQYDCGRVHTRLRQIGKKIVIAVDAGAVKLVNLSLVFIQNSGDRFVCSLPHDMGKRNIVYGVFHPKIRKHGGP